MIHNISRFIAALALLATAQGAWAQTPSGNWADEGNRATTVPQSEDGSTLYISTAEQLACYAYGVNNDWVTSGSASGFYCGRTVELMADIDLSAHYWTPIGINNRFYFSGFFHGNGHVISGMTIVLSEADGSLNANKDSGNPYIGLFGNLRGRNYGSGSSCITDLTLKDFSVNVTVTTKATFSVGGLVGTCSNRGDGTSITNCCLTNGTVHSNSVEVNVGLGGLVDKDTPPTTCTNNYRYNVTATKHITNIAPISGESVANCAALTVGTHGSVAIGGNVGVITDGKIYAASGETVTLSGTPEAGYMVGYTASGVTITDGAFTMPDNDDGTIAATFTPDPAHFSQSGDTYTIHTAAGWNVFCDLLADNTKGYFSGKTVALAADITVTRMAGSDHHDFCGTFDGGGHTLTFSHTATDNYCAPFRHVQGASAETPAVIRNLNVVSTVTADDYRHPAGLIALQSGHVSVTDCNVEAHINCTKGAVNTSDLYPAALVSQSNGVLTVSGCTTTGQIATDGKYAAGLIGIVQNTATITDCRVSVTIQSTTSGDGTHGGLVASQSSGTTITITGCVFDGRLLGSATNKCGGFIGWRGNTATIYNSLFAPAEVTVQNEGSATFARNKVDTYNSYYTYYLCDGTNYAPYDPADADHPDKYNNGHATRTVVAAADVTIDAVALTGTATQYTVSGITAYSGGGLQRGETLYYGSGNQLSLTLSNSATGAPQGYQYTYTASAGTLSGSTLTMPDQDVTVNVDTETLRSDGQSHDITYIDADGNEQIAQAIALDGHEAVRYDDIILDAGTYYVGTDIAYANRIWLNGDVTLILANGKTMTLDGNTKGIFGVSNNLTIYGQSLDAATAGTLSYNGTSYGIYVSNYEQHSGNVSITTTGSSVYGFSADVTLRGGTLTVSANGDNARAIIGYTHSILGGHLTANSTGTGDYATGIGAYANSGTALTLGWTRPADRITASSISTPNGGTVAVADGQKLHNGSDFLGGTLGDPAAAVNGKTLRPAATATYTTADGTAATADAILLDGSDNSLPAGNYLATGTLNYTHGITLAGNVTLILADNCHMNVGTSGERISGCGIEPDDNFEIDELPTLTITSESLGEDMGHLSVYTTGNGRECITTGTIDINGGNITADTDGSAAFPIYAFGDLTINGGTVTATTTGTYAHAIRAYGNFNYNGGNVTATAPAANANAICAYSGNYTFSWRTPTDRITIGATGLYVTNDKTATFARLFTDGSGNYYGATLTGTALNALKGVTLEAAETADFTVTLAPKGYGTYYDGHYDITLPAGTQARIVTARGATDGTLDYETIADGDDGITLPKTVPAGTAVMLCHDGGGTVTLTVHDADIDQRDFTKASGNTPGLVSLLHGSDVAATTTGGTLYYKLTYGSATGHEDIFGWYWGATDGAAFESPAHKAWLALPATSLARSFIGLPDSDDNTTGITTTNDTNDTNSAGAWYTLDGRKLDGTPMKSGIYVNNGKMVIIK